MKQKNKALRIRPKKVKVEWSNSKTTTHKFASKTGAEEFIRGVN